MGGKRNLIGSKFGKILVVSEVEKKGHNVLWHCKCDCGKELDVLGPNLNKKTKSCGCEPNAATLGRTSPFWRGCGEISIQFYNRIKICALKRNIDVSVTIEQLWELFLFQDRKCALSGEAIVFANSLKKHETTASLDRIDSKKSYTLDNVQWVHKHINTMKQYFNDDYFISWCTKVAKYSKEKQND